MKHFILILTISFLGLQLAAQTPQGINYQAVARTNMGDPIPSSSATINFKIRHGSTSGNIVFEETQNKTTDACGMFTLKIGQANAQAFSVIDWSTGAKFLEVTINGSVTGTTEILSVPYALYAEKTKLHAGSGISVSGNEISNAGDLSNTNEIQILSVSGNQLSISGNGGNSVTLPTPSIQLANITDDMPTSFTTTVRGAAWQTMESKLQAQAPSAGIYLILYTLRATNFTDNDVVFFKVSNAVTGGDYASSVLMSANNGLKDVTSSSFCIANLSQGEVVQVREKMEGSGTSTVLFQDGRLALIKIQ